MEFFQVIALLCATAQDKRACEDYYWKCYVRGELTECVVNKPYEDDDTCPKENGETGVLDE